MNKTLSFFLLSAWPLQRQKKFIDALQRASFSDEQIIFERGDTEDNVYFIVKGAVKSLNYNADGKISYFRMRQSGDCFGYYSAISEQPRTATMIAIGETELARMRGRDFLSLVVDNPEIGRPFLKLVVGLLRTETNRLTNLTTMPAPQRVAMELAAQNTPLFSLPERNEFASYLGMTRETLSRALASLARKKLIKVTGKNIVILDLKGLMELANKIV